MYKVEELTKAKNIALINPGLTYNHDLLIIADGIGLGKLC